MPRSAELKGVWTYVTVAEGKPLSKASSDFVAAANAYRANPCEETRKECLNAEKAFFSLWSDMMSKREPSQEAQVQGNKKR